MKKRKTTIFEIASLVMTAAGFIWIGGFQYSAIQRDIHYMKEDIQELKTDVKRIEARLDRMENEFNQEFP
ncbi:MAG: hypothetical protein WDO15_01660 [Bacteroidota bacterium]